MWWPKLKAVFLVSILWSKIWREMFRGGGTLGDTRFQLFFSTRMKSSLFYRENCLFPFKLLPGIWSFWCHLCQLCYFTLTSDDFTRRRKTFSWLPRKGLRAQLHDTNAVYDCSLWCIRFSRKSLQHQVQHLRANSKQELCFYDIIAFAKMKNRIGQSYRMDRP